MSEFTQFITENMYIVAAVLYVLGVFLKSIPKKSFPLFAQLSAALKTVWSLLMFILSSAAAAKSNMIHIKKWPKGYEIYLSPI